MMKPSGECINSQNLKESNGMKMLDLLISLVILVFCFLLSRGVIIYQRRLIQINNRQPCHEYEASEQAHQLTKFDSSSSSRTMKAIKTPGKDPNVNDEAVYELPDSVVERIDRNEAEPEISTGQESSTDMSLKDNKEPGNVYQSVQPKKDNRNAMEYENPAFTFSGT